MGKSRKDLPRAAFCALVVLLGACSVVKINEKSLISEAKASEVGIPLPDTMNVRSAKPREEVWKLLNEKEKAFVYHMQKASALGRTLLFHQSHRHALAIKAFLENAYSKHNQNETKQIIGEEGYRELLVYLSKFESLGGPYESSNRKYLLKKNTAEDIQRLWSRFGRPKTPKNTVDEIVKLMTDPVYEALQMPESPDGKGLELTGGNIYAKGIAGEEVAEAIKKSEKFSGLNCRIVRDEINGELTCEKQFVNTPGIVGYVLRGVVRELKLAKRLALSQHQADQIHHLIRYFQTGEEEDFRQSSISWVKAGSDVKVDFMMGYVEVYQDYLAKVGTWESYIQVLDPVTTERSKKLAQNAQYFENKMPYGEWKKTFAKDYSPPALMVYYFQEISSYATGGYNLPNYDDIRRDIGFKNIIRQDFPGQEKDPLTKSMRKEMLEEFSTESTVEDVLENFDGTYNILVLQHEIIGHGSGTYDEKVYGAKVDPISALGNLGSALEEQRADLTSLVFAGDPKLVEIGFYKDEAEAKKVLYRLYDFYMSDFVRRLSRLRTLTESHQRGHWLYIHHLLDAGAIGWVARDEKSPVTVDNQVLKVLDYEKMHKVSVDLLAELQRIKATKDDAGLRKLFAEKAPLDAANEPWAQAIVRRGEKLRMNKGSIEQPWSISSDLEYKTYGDAEHGLEGIAEFYTRY